MSDIQEFFNRKQQSIGRFKFEDKTFRKKVRFSKHFFRMRDSWGIDKTVFNTLGDLGCEQIRILDEESNRIYSISYRDFFSLSILDKSPCNKYTFGNLPVNNSLIFLISSMT